MAQIKVFQGGSIQPDAPQVTPYRAPDFGPGIGPGIAKLGESVGEAADVVSGISALHDEAAVKKLTNGISDWYSQAAYTGPNAYFNTQGEDALNGSQMISGGLQNLVKDQRAQLQNERQRYLFDEAVQPQVREWGAQIAEHAHKETIQWNVDESTSRAGVVGELARHSYIADPKQGEAQIATGASELANSLKLQGAGPEQIAAKTLTYTSGIYHDVGIDLASSGPQGPELARAFVDQHKDSMTSDHAQSVLDRADTEQRGIEAEQRRIEADQRRTDREAEQDARSTVETALGRMGDAHVPLKADEYASVLDAARSTKDVQLVKRVQEAQFKNGVMLENQNATPTDLQNKVNALSAKITKAGTNADTNDVIERDTLSGMLSNSNAEIGRDQLSWAARTQGLNVLPLNLDDPNSVSARIQATMKAAQLSGHAAQPLTSEEAASYTSQLSAANVQQQVALATHIARLGPLAMPAAQQITNNTGFHNLIGLATLNNHAVAASRVNEVVTGYDVLKGKPKLIDQNQSQQQFEQYVGGALQFFPSTANGVMSNAKAILATEANQHGWNEWGDVDKRAWFRSVNSALGAYTNAKGEQVGGLWGYNGGTTVLPEDMTGGDFEQRIARSNGPQFRSAQNGVPVFANGSSPTATDLKRMQWIPSADGIYRLSDGHGFLHTKQGSFYEIDVRKLPTSLDAQLAAHGYTRH